MEDRARQITPGARGIANGTQECGGTVSMISRSAASQSDNSSPELPARAMKISYARTRIISAVGAPLPLPFAAGDTGAPGDSVAAAGTLDSTADAAVAAGDFPAVALVFPF